jgi:serine/threonine protein kinase
MGRVYVGRLTARHGVQRLVAIKLLRTVPSRSTRAALLREARVTARLHHRNVVPTLELDEHDSAPFVVMELVDGGSLAGLLLAVSDAGEKLDIALAAWLVAQAAAGLHAAHELTNDAGVALGLVHRDISPHNVLLSIDGRVLLADFGIAKLTDSNETTESGVIKGKYAYMSPEQANGEPLDRRSDLFSLGLVLYQALTGQRAFGGERPAEQLLRLLNDEPPSPSTLRPEIDLELSAITLRCLAKKPADRFATALDLAEALRAWSRQVGADADEAELARWMDRFLGESRQELLGRVRKSIETLDAAPASPPNTLVAATTSAPMHQPARAKRGWVLGPLAAAVLGVVGVAAATGSTRESGPPTASSVPSPSTEAAPGAVPGVPATAAGTTPSSPEPVHLSTSPPLPPAASAHPDASTATSRAKGTPSRRSLSRSQPPPASSPSGTPFNTL